ncbi:hypothetical protein HPY42_00055 [Coprothermobacteraceae bacterium]|nr:hypothetical protein [Coprothermobacteraceae bacterium]
MKWRIFLVLTILGIIGGVWLVFSFVVPPPKGNLQVLVPKDFKVYVDGREFTSGPLSAGSHEVDVRFGDAVLVKERVRVQPGDNAKRAYDPKGLLLVAPQGSVFFVQAGGRGYQARGNYFWLPGFAGASLVQINGSTLPVHVAPNTFTALGYVGGDVVPLTGTYWTSTPLGALVDTNQGTATLPTVLPNDTKLIGSSTVDGSVAVVSASLATEPPLRVMEGSYQAVKVTGSESMVVMTATSASQYNIIHGWRVWTIQAPEANGRWLLSDSGFLFVGERIWAYKDNGAWLWVRSPKGQLVSVAGDYLVFEKDGTVLFWDFLTGNPAESPVFPRPSEPKYLLGSNYLYSSDGTWYTGVAVLSYHSQGNWVAAVTKANDIMIWRR